MDNPGFGGRNIRMRFADLKAYFKMVDEARKVGEQYGVESSRGLRQVFPLPNHARYGGGHQRPSVRFRARLLHHHTSIFQDWLYQHKLHSDYQKIDTYFRLLTDAVHSRRYDSIAHPDVIRIYTVETFRPEDYEDVIRGFLRECVTEDICLEVNTAA